MCVRCGTGRIAWCTSPDAHAAQEQAAHQEAEAAKSMDRAALIALLLYALKEPSGA